MPVVQVPPAVGTSGQFIDAIVITSSTLREIIVLGDPLTSGAFATVTSSQGLQVSSTQSHTIISASSGLVQTLTSGPVTIAGTVTILSASSGLVQTLTSGPTTISGTVTILSASSGLVQTLTSGPTTISGTVTILSASSGLVQTLTTGAYPVLTSGTLVIVSASSGLVQTLTSGPLTISGTVTVLNTSSGVVQITASTYNPLAFIYVSSSSGNSNSVVSGTRTFYGFYAFNTTQAPRYLKVYGTSSAPTIGSTVGMIGNFGIPASTGAGGAGGQHIIQPFGVLGTGGIGFTIVSGVDTTSTGIIGNQDIGLTLYYI